MMKQVIWRSAVAAVILAAGSAPLSAQVMVSSPVRFGIAGGATLPVSDLKDIAETGWHAGALLDIGVPLFPLGFRVDAMWNQLGKKDVDFASVKNRIIDGTVNAVYTFGAMSPTKFYLIGGVGVYNVKTEIESTGSPVLFALADKGSEQSLPGISRQLAPPSQQIIEDGDNSSSQTKFGLNAGAGFRFQFTGFSTFVEARWHTIFTNGNNAQMIPISVGLTF